MSRTAKWVWTLIIGLPLLALAIWGLVDNARLFLLAFMVYTVRRAKDYELPPADVAPSPPISQVPITVGAFTRWNAGSATSELESMAQSGICFDQDFIRVTLVETFSSRNSSYASFVFN